MKKKKPQTKSTSKTTECLSQIYACNKDFMHKCPMPWQQQLLYMTFTLTKIKQSLLYDTHCLFKTTLISLLDLLNKRKLKLNVSSKNRVTANN